MAIAVVFSLHIIIFTFTLCVTISAVKFTNANEELSKTWTEIVSVRYYPPYDTGNQRTLKTIFAGDNNHSLVLLKWTHVTESHTSIINLTVRTHTFDGRVYEKICDIVVPPGNKTAWIVPATVKFLKTDRILLTWKEKHEVEGSRLKLQVVFVDTCKSSEFVQVNVVQNSLLITEYELNGFIVKLKNTFEVILKYPLICPAQPKYAKPCRIVLDYDGNQLTNGPETVTGTNDSFENMSLYEAHEIIYNDGEGYVFVASNVTSLAPKDIFAYSPIVGWIQVDDESTYYTSYYSNSSGFACLCWKARYQEIRCKWLDGTHESNHTLTAKLHWDYNDVLFDISIVNNPNGRVVMLHSLVDDRGNFLAADEIQSNGKCKRVAKIQISDVPRMARLSIDSQNRYCFSYIMNKLLTDEPRTFEYTFGSQCTKILNEDSAELHTCVENY